MTMREVTRRLVIVPAITIFFYCNEREGAFVEDFLLLLLLFLRVGTNGMFLFPPFSFKCDERKNIFSAEQKKKIGLEIQRRTASQETVHSLIKQRKFSDEHELPFVRISRFIMLR